MGVERATGWRWIFRGEAGGRLRAPWRLVIFVLLIGAIANPMILLLDATDIRLLERAGEPLIAGLACLAALAISARLVERRFFDPVRRRVTPAPRR